MNSHNARPSDIHARLRSARMTATERRDAMAYLQGGEALADLLREAARRFRYVKECFAQVLRSAVQGLPRLGGNDGRLPAVRSRLDCASRRRQAQTR